MATHIQIGDISPRIQYTADGVQTAFTYPFPIFTDADVRVYEDAVLKTLTTDYAVTGAGNSAGGLVTFTVAPAVAVVITLKRALAIKRTTDFQESGEFRAKV
ncbi:MAG TPA: hydrolase, partial [Alphaproteobacteria bacterium]|nr:hydrolase [Alphaproteobacteria bacterium]